MKVVVTGGSGFVGSSLRSYTDWLFPTRHELDLLHKESIDIYFSNIKPNVVVHLATQYNSLNNTQLNLNIMQACERFSVSKIILVSPPEIFPNSYMINATETILDKIPIEIGNEGCIPMRRLLDLQRHFLVNTKYICLFPTNLFGSNDNNLNHIIPSLRNSLPKIYDHAKSQRQFLYIEDFSNIIYECVHYEPKSRGEFFICAPDEKITMEKVANILTDKNVEYIPTKPRYRNVFSNKKLLETFPTLTFSNFEDTFIRVF